MDESRRLQGLSYGLYMIVNTIVGPEREIHIRRTVTNLRNDFIALYRRLKNSHLCPYLSGSYAEGFRFSSSDVDFMFVLRHVIVTNNQELYDNNNDNIIVLSMDTYRCRPGFSLLRLEHIPQSHENRLGQIPQSRENNVTLVLLSCVQLPQGVYVSSSLWREEMPKEIPNGQLHGPCHSGVIGNTEVDFAYCLRCDTWPKSAVGCIKRLQRLGWPSADVLSNILKEGCHMVAIGAKGSHYENTEWRISFSFAEKTLIHQMNQCQFLCYGSLKIFLKEAIKRENEESLICSYFLKTAVFWEICEGHTQWSSTTFLQCFWACFRRLISWVYNGYCPNFFIPENNMFFGKIHGRAQVELLGHLTVLYKEGYNCLLRCPSLQPLLGVMVVNQQISPLLLPSENQLYSNSYYAVFIIRAIMDEEITGYYFGNMQIVLQTLSMLTDQNNAVRSLTLDVWKRNIKQFLIVFSSHRENYTHNLHNQEIQHYMRYILQKLKHQSYDLLNHKILSCLYLYRRGLHSLAVKALLQAKSKLQQPNVMYQWNLSVDKYIAEGGEHTPLTTMMKKVIVCPFHLPMDIYVPELTMEHQASSRLLDIAEYFPPLAIVNFLLYLSYYRLGQFTEANAVMEELAVLLAFGGKQHIHVTQRAISWTMLGICQEMSGQLTNAHHSYTEALHDQYSRFKDSTRVRIENILMKMNV